jgi:YHS domain-containing protein
MKTKLMSVLLAMFVAHAGYVFAEEAAQGTEATQAVNVGNKICPVTGEKVDGEMGGGTYEYKGKIYNLCCKMCTKDFSKDPEKYSKIADEEVAAQQKNGEAGSAEQAVDDHDGHEHTK